LTKLISKIIEIPNNEQVKTKITVVKKSYLTKPIQRDGAYVMRICLLCSQTMCARSFHSNHPSIAKYISHTFNQGFTNNFVEIITKRNTTIPTLLFGSNLTNMIALEQ
jgi:hypothetical protein